MSTFRSGFSTTITTGDPLAGDRGRKEVPLQTLLEEGNTSALKLKQSGSCRVAHETMGLPPRVGATEPVDLRNRRRDVPRGRVR
jgi:hypothetical protein